MTAEGIAGASGAVAPDIDVEDLKQEVKDLIAGQEEIRFQDDTNPALRRTIDGKDLVENGENRLNLEGQCYPVSMALYELIEKSKILENTGYTMKLLTTTKNNTTELRKSTKRCKYLITLNEIRPHNKRQNNHEHESIILDIVRHIHYFIVLYPPGGDPEKAILVDGTFENYDRNSSFFIGTKQELKDKFDQLFYAEAEYQLTRRNDSGSYLIESQHINHGMIMWSLSALEHSYTKATDTFYAAKLSSDFRVDIIRLISAVPIHDEELKTLIELSMDAIYTNSWDQLERNSPLLHPANSPSAPYDDLPPTKKQRTARDVV